MRSKPVNHGRGLGTAACALAAMCLGGVAGAQRIPQRIQPTPIDFATGDDDNLFSLSRSQEDIHELETSLAELAKGDFKAAVERLHKLLQTEIGGVVPIAPGRFLGLRLATVTTMANLPPAAAEAYEELVQREAGALAARPLHLLERDHLLLLAERFPASRIGRRARLRLADLAFTAGDALAAQDHYRQALDALPIGSVEERQVAERLQCATVLRDPATARADAAAKRLGEAGEDVLTVRPAADDEAGWRAIGGGGDGRLPMAEPAGAPQPSVSVDVASPGFDRRDSGQFAMFPVGDLDGIFVNTGSEVLAFDPARGGLSWVSPSPMRDGNRGFGSYLDSTNQDMVLSAALGGDLVMAALQVPEDSKTVDFQASFRIISKIPQRRLFAFSRRTGKLVWSHFDELDGQRTRRFRGNDSCAPPLVLGDTVYAPMHDRSGAIQFSIAAYDLRTGQPKWRRLVCSSQQDVNMFGNARMEFASTPLCASDGVLYGASNLGVAFAIERASGRLRWITSYAVVQMPRAMLHNQQDRPVYFANNAPVAVEGVVCCTPLDSPYVLGLDAETGDQLWRLPADAVVAGAENRVRWLIGTLDDEFVLAGRAAVAVKARPERSPTRTPVVRQLVPPEAMRARADGLLVPRPALTADHVWLAQSDRILGFDRAGNRVESQIALPHNNAGNLLLVEGLVVSLRQHALDVLLDAEALQQRVQAKLAASPDEPAMILRLARLRTALLSPDSEAAAHDDLRALYRRGIEACVRAGLPNTHPVHQALQRELFEQAFQDAQAAKGRADARALELLVTAREAAPDEPSFVLAQALVLELCRAEPDRFRKELDVLEREAGGATFPGGAGIPVRTWVLWQRAAMADQPPREAVAKWQELLEGHGTEHLDDGTAAEVATAAIALLVEQHGRDIYAPIAARAAAALQRAGTDATALRDVGRRYPNSEAAQTAHLRLLDQSVRNGELSLACEVLAAGARSGAPAPGVLRRVLVAALVRGNGGLADAMIARLHRHAETISDWPDDAGATYGAVLSTLAKAPAAAPPAALELPQRELARIPLQRSPRQINSLVPVIHAPGFAPSADEPLFVVVGGNELLAIDVHARSQHKPILFRQPVQFLDYVIVCGSTIVVPDLERVFGLDARSGRVLWDLPGAGERLFEGLRVQSGVLHVSAMAGAGDGTPELLGVEPLSGSILFRRPLPRDGARFAPKQSGDHLLLLEARTDGSSKVHHIDPVSGETMRTVDIGAELLRDRLRLPPDAFASRDIQQGLCADDRRIYLPVDSALSGEAPKLAAINADGSVAWQWEGRAQNTLLMTALRGDRIVVVEGDERRAGRILLLAAATGEVLRHAELGLDVTILNWERSRLAGPAPALVAISDRPETSGRQRRFVGFAVEDGLPTFEVRLAAEESEIDREPLIGPDFVTFGVRPVQRGMYRLYTLRLQDRSGALPDGAKYQRLDLRATQGVAALGAYTVVASSESILVLGAERGDK